ncbi:MAG: HEPN domain-containing protein [Chloroflexi bacterium]|nr:HEPN domain-containing protein [Chloroflexota bacterium]
MKDETRTWVEIAESDLEMASVALEKDFYQHTVFCCQQSIEKLMKAIWTERHGVGTHPRVHNLVKLADGLDLDVPAQWRNLVVDLTDQIFPSRYPEAGWQYEREVAEEYYNTTQELFAWLRQLLT